MKKVFQHDFSKAISGRIKLYLLSEWVFFCFVERERKVYELRTMVHLNVLQSSWLIFLCQFYRLVGHARGEKSQNLVSISIKCNFQFFSNHVWQWFRTGWSYIVHLFALKRKIFLRSVILALIHWLFLQFPYVRCLRNILRVVVVVVGKYFIRYHYKFFITSNRSSSGSSGSRGWGEGLWVKTSNTIRWQEMGWWWWLMSM